MRAGTDWMTRAMCASVTPQRWDAFTAPQQKQICGGCPVQHECLDWVTKIESSESRRRYGVIAGQLPEERRRR